MILPLQQPYDSPYAVLRCGPHSFTIRVGARDEIVSVSSLEPFANAEVTPGSPRHRSQPPSAGMMAKPATACCSSPPAPRRVLFSDPLVSTPSCQEQLRGHPGTVFSQPCRGVFARPGPAAPSQTPQQRYTQRQRRPPVRINL
jgi:hypothetical protein